MDNREKGKNLPIQAGNSPSEHYWYTRERFTLQTILRKGIQELGLAPDECRDDAVRSQVLSYEAEHHILTNGEIPVESAEKLTDIYPQAVLAILNEKGLDQLAREKKISRAECLLFLIEAHQMVWRGMRNPRNISMDANGAS